MKVSIADILFSISGMSTWSTSEVQPEYRSFVLTPDHIDRQEASIRIQLSCDRIERPCHLLQTFASHESWQLFSGNKDFVFTLQPPAFEQPFLLAEINSTFTCAKLTYNSSLIDEDRNQHHKIPAVPIQYPFDQIFLMHHLAEREGIILHAAGIELQGKAYIFPGRSGAGKSTISRQFAHYDDFRLLSDDRIIIRNIAGKLFAYGTPWPGEAGIAENRKVELGGIFFINHGTENRLQEISTRNALERLLPVASIPWYDRTHLPGVLDFCETVLTETPVLSLDFTPDKAIANLIRAHVAS